MIRVGIVGYGNLGKGVESAVSKTKDMEIAAYIHMMQIFLYIKWKMQ